MLYEVITRLVLLREIERDGLETYVGMTQRFHGMLFLISLVPFRSYWKYGERSWRYCYLDAGHQYGALGETLHYYGHTPTLLSQVERGELNRLMGFDAEEFGCAIVAVGEATLREAEPMRTPLMRVAPTDYSEGIGNLKTACSEVVSLGSEAIRITSYNVCYTKLLRFSPADKGKPFGDNLEQVVADIMAEGVIDLFKTVKIEKQNRKT